MSGIQIQENFILWLDEELSSRNWSDYRLAKHAGISHSVLSKARSGTLPKWDACLAIAKALGFNPVLIFEKAGLLPPTLEKMSWNDTKRDRVGRAKAFSGWLTEQLEARGWSHSELSRRSRLSASVIDKVVACNSRPGIRFMEGLAGAFRISIHEVLFLWEGGEFGAWLTYDLANLPKGEQALVLDYIGFLRFRRGKENNNRE